MANVYLTLADWSRRADPDGEIADIAELLSQCNEIFDDMLWRESNLPTSHKFTYRTGLPQGTWRAIGQGVPFTKSTTAQGEVGMAMLEAYSRIDRKLAELEGDIAALRLSEDDAHLEGLSQQMASTFFYGNVSANLTQFNGLSQYYGSINTATAANAVNVLNGGAATGSTSCSSLWAVGWGERTIFSVFPKSSKAGLQFEDKGDIRPGLDANGFEYEAFTSWFRWEASLVVKDWRYGVRIANLDSSSSAGGLNSSTPPDLFALMSKAVVRFPTLTKRASGITKTDAPDETAPGIQPAWYCNRTVREYLDIQAIRDKNVLLKPTEYAGEPIVEFRGIPIRISDALSSAESALT